MDINLNDNMDEQRFEAAVKGIKEFIFKLSVKSGIINDEMDSKKKEEILKQVIKKIDDVCRPQQIALDNPDKVIDFNRRRKEKEITNEALIPFIIDGQSKSDSKDFRVASNAFLEAKNIFNKWGIENDEFLKMVNEYRQFGIKMPFAQQMVIQIDKMLKAEKSSQAEDSL